MKIHPKHRSSMYVRHAFYPSAFVNILCVPCQFPFEYLLPNRKPHPTARIYVTLTLSVFTFMTINGLFETAQGTEKIFYQNTGSNLLKRTEPNPSRLTIYPSYPILFIFLKTLEAFSSVILDHIDWTTQLYNISLPIFREFSCLVLKCIL